MAVLTLDGKADGAVNAVSQVTTGAQNLKQHLDAAAQSAKGVADELEAGGGSASVFSSGLGLIVGELGALVGPAALLAAATAGVRDYADQLQRAGDLAKNVNIAPLAQLGPQAGATARSLVAAGVPEQQAAGVAQSLEGASAVDAAFIRAAAPTGVFGGIPSMELSARAYEAQFGGDLPTLVSKSAAAFGGTGLNAEQGLSQIQSLSPAFSGTGIGGNAGVALAGEMARLYGGEGTSKLQQLLQGGERSGLFEHIPADVKNDPMKLLAFIRSRGTDDGTLEQEFGKRAILPIKALLGAGDDVAQRFGAVQGASASGAYGMLGTARSDASIATGIAGQEQTGSQLVHSEDLGVLGNLYSQETTARMNTLRNGGGRVFGGAGAGLMGLGRWLHYYMSDEGSLREELNDEAAGQGNWTVSEKSRRDAIQEEQLRHLQAISRNTNSGPQPSGRQE